MQAVVLAAGKGTRLQPLSHRRSKAMAPVAGTPMVGRVIDLLRSQGISHLVLIAGPDDAALQQYADDVRGDGLTVDVVVQQARQGMARALQLAQPFVAGDFVLAACDNLVPEKHMAALIDAHRTRNAAATLSLMRVPPARVASTGIVEWRDERIVRIVEKPRPEAAPSDISSLPLYVFSPAIFELLPRVKPSARGEYELQDAIQLLVDRGDLVTGVFTATRMQLTNLDDLLALNRHFLAESAALTIAGGVEIGAETVFRLPVRIDANVRIGAGCTIGPDVYLAAGCRVEDGAALSDVIVLEGVRVAAKVTCTHDVLVE